MNSWGSADEGAEMPPGIEFVSLAQMMDQRRMAAQEMRASIDRFFEELTGDQSFTLLRMLNYVVNDQPHGRDTAQFWCGVLATYLKVKHGLCSSCGNEHNEMEHILEEQAPSSEPFIVHHISNGTNKGLLVQRGSMENHPIREFIKEMDDAQKQIIAKAFYDNPDADLKRWCQIESEAIEAAPYFVMAALSAYEVNPTHFRDATQLRSEVYCRFCEVTFHSLNDRMVKGLKCPACDNTGLL